MAHNKVYGICENKCRVEVSPRDITIEKTNFCTLTQAGGIATSPDGENEFFFEYPPSFTKANTKIIGVDLETVNGDVYSLPYVCDYKDSESDPTFAYVMQGIYRDDAGITVNVKTNISNDSLSTMGLSADLLVKLHIVRSND